MSEDNKQSFANFMAPKNDSEKSASVMGSNKTQESLEGAKQKKEEENKKELTDAKKNSIALANRYNKAGMMAMQGKKLIMLLPFIILGVIIFLFILFKGGDFLSQGMNLLFKNISGQ